MTVNFDSEAFTGLTVKEKREVVITEFTKCKSDFNYFINNYSYIRHPNVGILKITPFDFQLDVAIPIAETLKQKRSAESIESLRLYKHKFDYDKWWKKIAEENIELARTVPAELHNFYKVTSKHEDFNTRVDTILLKSRQTGLSTIFQILAVWHINFNRNVYDLIISQGDREAIKFLNDVTSVYDNIPGPIKSKLLNSNEHELWCSITGDKGKRSGMQALPPTAKAGRSYSPNLVVLDEFAEYAHAEKVWTAISMSVSAGGIIVIIATPKGVGNLYHKIWQMTNKSLTMSVSSLAALEKDQRELSVFRPMAVHWSQLPLSEFTRRGFSSSLAWYKHMKSKISMEKGDKAIAQELDLDFAASGNTMDAALLDELMSTCLENVIQDILVLDQNIPGLVIYEPPVDGYEYMIGVDTAEGVRADYSVATVFKLPKNLLIEGTVPTVVAKYASNVISVRRYTEITRLTGMLYNESWINIERNNHGHVLLAYFIEDGQYNQDKILNKFDAIKSVFSKDTKGWGTQVASKTLLIATFQDFLTTNREIINVPLELCDELRTYIQKADGKWDAQEGYFADHILSFAIGIMGCILLPRYKQFLLENSSGYSPNEISDDMLLSSSTFIDDDLTALKALIKKERIIKDIPFLHKNDVDIDDVRLKLMNRKILEQDEPSVVVKHKDKHLYISTTVDYDDIDEDTLGVF